MTKNYLLPIILLFSIAFLSFNSHSKKNDVLKGKKTLILTPENTTVHFTAYKTSDKIPVKGQFTESRTTLPENASTPMEALNGLQFKIPVSSLTTNNKIRDGKLKNSFFRAMLNTAYISGTISIKNNSEGTVALTMNGVTTNLPIDIAVKDKTATIKGVVELKNWDALNALASLNEACLLLHKGPDGVSKTWEDVAIEVTTTFE